MPGCGPHPQPAAGPMTTVMTHGSGTWQVAGAPDDGRTAMAWNKALAGGTAAGTVAIAALARRYAAGVARADRSWPAQVEGCLRDLGEVDEVSVLPLVERLTAEGSGLAGEPGVSYLI